MTLPHTRTVLISPTTSRNRWLLRPIIVLLVVSSLLAACGGNGGPKAPDFSLTQFDGSEFRLSSHAEENLVVLNFWFPSCPPCREEMPSFENAWNRLQEENVKFLGVFVPQGFDSEQDARDFVAELGLTYGFATDLGALVAWMFQIEVYPTTVFIDKSGRVFQTQIAALDEEKIVGIVRAMSGGPG